MNLIFKNFLQQFVERNKYTHYKDINKIGRVVGMSVKLRLVKLGFLTLITFELFYMMFEMINFCGCRSPAKFPVAKIYFCNINAGGGF